jgi:hypothetical protein
MKKLQFLESIGKEHNCKNCAVNINYKVGNDYVPFFLVNYSHNFLETFIELIV